MSEWIIVLKFCGLAVILNLDFSVQFDFCEFKHWLTMHVLEMGNHRWVRLD